MTEPIRVISYGGGVQSTALVILAAQRDPEFETVMGGQVTDALFSNVGDDSEHPDALAFVREVVAPWALEQGVNVHELRRVKRDGTVETLWEQLTRPESRSIEIPVRMDNGSPGNRNCTSTYKIKVIAKWLRQQGATKDNPATVAIGISTDELERATRRRPHPAQEVVYPLLEMGWDRSRCQRLIKTTLGVLAPKSSCFFCPFHKSHTWAEMRRDEPHLFEKSAELESILNERRTMLGKDKVWLTRHNKPLAEAIGEAQAQLFAYDGPEACDSGYCWT
jgi:hypothetical protein